MAALPLKRCPTSSSTPPTRPTADQPAAIDVARRGARGRASVPDPARRDRHRQDVHDGRRDRARPAPGAGDRAQQDARRAALQRVPRVLPRERRSSTSSPTTTTTSPRPTSRRRTSTSRRTRRSTTRSTASATPRPPALLARRDVIIVASVSCIYGIGSPELYQRQMQLFKVGRVDRARRACSASSSACSTAATTRSSPAARSRVQGRGAGDLPGLRRDGLPDRAVRRRGRGDPALRPAHRRDPRRGRPRRRLAGLATT